MPPYQKNKLKLT